jgi:hypothetical protein
MNWDKPYTIFDIVTKKYFWSGTDWGGINNAHKYGISDVDFYKKHLKHSERFVKINKDGTLEIIS